MAPTASTPGAPGSDRELRDDQRVAPPELNRVGRPRRSRFWEAAGFDAFVEGLCAPFYARMGRPSLAPNRYSRLLFVG